MVLRGPEARPSIPSAACTALGRLRPPPTKPAVITLLAYTFRMDHDLSEAALAELSRIEAEEQASSPPDPAFQVLRERGLIVGPYERTHITARGHRRVQ